MDFTNGQTYSTVDGQPTGVNISATPAKVFGWYFFNNAGSTRYIKLYNKATAPLSTDTPSQRLPVPAGGGSNVAFNNIEVNFNVGLGIRVTTGVADSDTGAPTANDVQVNIFYTN